MPRTKLSSDQRDALHRWAAEGLEFEEVAQRAGDYSPPFAVSPQLLLYYRRKAGALRSSLTESALTSGLALAEERVKRLAALAERLEADIMNGRLWWENVRAVGKEPVTVEEFNAAEVREYRGLLDDIAREVGGRQIKVDQSVKVDVRWNWEPPKSNI